MMSKDWAKSATNKGIPYYINHLTERTQWDHPDLVRYLKNLESMNNIRFAAYRTAMKLRTLQKLLHLDVVDLSVIDAAFEQHGFRYQNDTVMDTIQMYNIVYEIYFLTKSRGRSSINVDSCADLLHNWILNLYDTSRTGCLRVLSVKIGLTALCAGRISDKYKYLYLLVSDRAAGGVSSKNMTALLQDIVQIAESIGEAYAFGTNVQAAVNSCFQTVLGSMVTKERFIQWFMAEPQTIVWLPTMHRLATAETMKHEVKCNICKMHPIVGFRYLCLKCLNFDLCQNCFFTGRSSKNHKYTHPTQEYCMQASSKEDIRAFGKTIRNKLSKKHGRRIKQKYLAIDNTGVNRIADTQKSDPNGEVDTHVKMGQLSKRLAAVESMHPEGAYVDLPMAGPSLHRRLSSFSDEEDERERMELENLIDELEMENEDLLDEMENLRLERSRLPRHIQDSFSESSSDDDGVPGGVRRPRRRAGPKDESMRRQNEMMKARQEVLETNNMELEQQLEQLKDIMRKKYLSRHVQGTPTSRLVPLGAPPPYQSPRGDRRHNPYMDISGIGTGSNLINPPTIVHRASETGSNLVTPPMISHHGIETFDQLDGANVRPPLVRTNLHNSTPVLASQSHGGMDMIDSGQAPPSQLLLASTPVLTNQSNAGMDLIDRQLAPPSQLSLGAMSAPYNQSNIGMDLQALSLAGTQRDINQSNTDSNMIDSRLHPPSGLSLAATPGTRGVDQSLATSALIDRHMLLPPHLSDQSSMRFPNLGVSRAYPTEEEELDDLLLKLDDAYPVNFTYDSQLSSRLPSPSNHDALSHPDPQGRRGGHPQDMLTAAARVGQAMSSLVAKVAAADPV